MNQCFVGRAACSLRIAVECYECIFAGTGEVRGVKAGEDYAFEERDGEVCLCVCDEARDCSAKGDVGICPAGEVGRCAAGEVCYRASRACEAVRADASA